MNTEKEKLYQLETCPEGKKEAKGSKMLGDVSTEPKKRMNKISGRSSTHGGMRKEPNLEKIQKLMHDQKGVQGGMIRS